MDTLSILSCLSSLILHPFHPFLMCPYPIRWFPVPSVIAPSPRSPTLSGICQCTRRLVGFGWIFFLVQDDGETVLLRRLWLEVPPPAQHAKALGHSQDPGQGASCKTNHFPPDFLLTPSQFWELNGNSTYTLTQAKSKGPEEEKASKKEKLEEAKE